MAGIQESGEEWKVRRSPAGALWDKGGEVVLRIGTVWEAGALGLSHINVPGSDFAPCSGPGFPAPQTNRCPEVGSNGQSCPQPTSRPLYK